MECPNCRGRLVKGRTSYGANRRGYHLILDDIPAWICEQCGEPLFDAETVDAIQAMLRDVDEGMERLVAGTVAA
jgi:YgiT-type zinc finger domain-containing protein